VEETLSGSIWAVSVRQLKLAQEGLPACHELRKVVMTAKTYGGAVNSKVFTSLYLSVLTTVLADVSYEVQDSRANVREEIRHCSRRNNAKEHKHENISLDVRERKLQSNLERLMLAVNPIVLAYIFVESPNSQLTLFLSQPGRSSWEVWQNEVAEGSDCYGSHSFDNEEPFPS
jgi:hypothetical protein